MFGLQKQSHKNRVEIDTEHSLSEISLFQNILSILSNICWESGGSNLYEMFQE